MTPISGHAAMTEPQQAEPAVEQIVMVPNDSVGLLVGRGGSTIMSLQQDTGCRIHIPSAVEPGSHARRVTVLGTVTSVQAGTAAIHALID